MFEFEYEEKPGSDNSPAFLSSLLVNELVRFFKRTFLYMYFVKHYERRFIADGY